MSEIEGSKQKRIVRKWTAEEDRLMMQLVSLFDSVTFQPSTFYVPPASEERRRAFFVSSLDLSYDIRE